MHSQPSDNELSVYLALYGNRTIRNSHLTVQTGLIRSMLHGNRILHRMEAGIIKNLGIITNYIIRTALYRDQLKINYK